MSVAFEQRAALESFSEWAEGASGAQAGLLTTIYHSDKRREALPTQFMPARRGMHTVLVDGCDHPELMARANASLTAFDIVGVTECLGAALDAIDDAIDDSNTSRRERTARHSRHGQLIHERPSTTTVHLGGTAHARLVRDVDVAIRDTRLWERLRWITRCDRMLWHEAQRRVRVCSMTGGERR